LFTASVGSERPLVGVVGSVMVFFLINDIGSFRDVPPDVMQVLGDLGDKVIELSAVLLLEILNPTVGWRTCLTVKYIPPIAESTVVLYDQVKTSR
jgi:hypothetical protein